MQEAIAQITQNKLWAGVARVAMACFHVKAFSNIAKVSSSVANSWQMFSAKSTKKFGR
jgi:hypothetical protein